MIKKCAICGTEFNSPPSSKKITCSSACSIKRKTISHKGKRNKWNADARKRISEKMKTQGNSESLKLARAAAMALPEGRRGPQNRGAKRWVLIAPDDTRYEIVNLLDWARKHAHWFDIVEGETDRERIARNILSGFGQIVQSMLGRKKHPCFTYKGWRLGDWPREK